MDQPIKKLLALINNLDGYYTTSSCSGRILVIELKDRTRKDLAEFILNAHTPVTEEDLYHALTNSKKERVWLLVQPPILHVATPTIKAGMELLIMMKKIGCKRAGIISSTPEKTVVEIRGTESMELPLAKKGVILFDREYLKELTKEANTKLHQAHKTLSKWETVFSKKLT